MLTHDQSQLLDKLIAEDEKTTAFVLKEIQNPWGSPWIKFVELFFLFQEIPMRETATSFFPHKNYEWRIFWFFNLLNDFEKHPNSDESPQVRKRRILHEIERELDLYTKEEIAKVNQIFV